jgi:hypothetical protein
MLEDMEVPQDGMATVFRSAGFAQEMEAHLVRGMLESNGVPAFVTGTELMPGPYRFPFQEICVQVPEDRRDGAERLIADARAAGPAAAEAAELAGEGREA